MNPAATRRGRLQTSWSFRQFGIARSIRCVDGRAQPGHERAYHATSDGHPGVAVATTALTSMTLNREAGRVGQGAQYLERLMRTMS